MVDPEISAYLLENTTKERINEIKKHEQFNVDNYDCFINIKYSMNDSESINVDSKILKDLGEANLNTHSILINERRWVLLNYPSKLDAYKTSMTTKDFYDYSINSMNFDYSKMYNDIKPLKELMEKTKKVRILSPNTDLTFSIEGMPARECCGKCNLPDGEIYTAPIKNSVNGVITYNTDSPYNGYTFKNICLKFKDGKIIEATSNNDEKINKIFDTDNGSRYIGEFAIGLNPMINKPMGDILFDEKISGSIHFTPGKAYKDAYNGNDSSIHWDLVLIQTKEYGGGQIYFDDILVRENGLFVLDSLKHLNYEIK